MCHVTPLNSICRKRLWVTSSGLVLVSGGRDHDAEKLLAKYHPLFLDTLRILMDKDFGIWKMRADISRHLFHNFMGAM
jgi:hypothetical protein